MKHERGGVAGVALALIIVTVAILLAPFFFLGKVVEPNQIGLRQNFFGLLGIAKAGYQDAGLPPGLHWQMPFVSKVHVLPRDFLVIHFASQELEGDLSLPQLEIPTTDGSKVRTDITLIVRYFENPSTVKTKNPLVKGTDAVPVVAENQQSAVPLSALEDRPHGGPREVVNQYRTNVKEQLRIFTSTAEEFVKKSLSTLSTIDYYNPVLRERAALTANSLINNEVNPDGIASWATLIRRYVYSKREIDEKIFQKNFQEQLERRIAAERELAAAKAETERQLQEKDTEIAVLRAEGDKKKIIFVAEADRYVAEQNGHGEQLLIESEARVKQEMNTIFSEVAGANVYVAREMVPLLTTLQGGILSNIDPYNVGAWMEKLLAKSSK